MGIDQEVIDLFLREVRIESQSPIDPVVVHHVPEPWEVVGTGNYAGVFAHPDFPEAVLKLYAPDRPGWGEERKVYEILGDTPWFPTCYQAKEGYLVIQRIEGISLFDCVRYGIPIPPQVIEDVEEALSVARQKGLFPHDVHGKNVLMHHGRGYLIDVSDYLKNIPDRKWQDLRKAYYKVYLPFLKDRGWKIPLWTMNVVRKGYRLYRKVSRLFS
ncbi:serine/threonine protein kinase [Brevibacillus sp. TJ4]|uniref:serine/threonine protein kinase n=1 Tax=Brevibacillus sp. TJ4 TaxID=3234853 RepID=UPI0037D85ED6